MDVAVLLRICELAELGECVSFSSLFPNTSNEWEPETTNRGGGFV